MSESQLPQDGAPNVADVGPVVLGSEEGVVDIDGNVVDADLEFEDPTDDNSRRRHFCLTWNNYPENFYPILKGYVTEFKIQYLKFGLEVSKTGTPHLQMHVMYRNDKTKLQVIKNFPGCHVMFCKNPVRSLLYVAKGDMDSDYFKSLRSPDKDPKYGNNAAVFDFGKPPVFKLKEKQEKGGVATAAKWEQIWDHAKAGRVESIPASERVRCYNTIKRIQIEYRPPPVALKEAHNYWVWGPAGCGKTTWFERKFKGNYYRKSLTSKWWNGYDNHDVVLLNEVSQDAAKYNMAHYLKEWGDLYPFQIEMKGTMFMIRPKTFYVMSNYSMEQVFENQADLVAIRERFQEIQFTAFLELTRHPFTPRVYCDDEPVKETDLTHKGVNPYKRKREEYEEVYDAEEYAQYAMEMTVQEQEAEFFKTLDGQATLVRKAMERARPLEG